VVIKEALL